MTNSETGNGNNPGEMFIKLKEEACSFLKTKSELTTRITGLLMAEVNVKNNGELAELLIGLNPESEPQESKCATVKVGSDFRRNVCNWKRHPEVVFFEMFRTGTYDETEPEDQTGPPKKKARKQTLKLERATESCVYRMEAQTAGDENEVCINPAHYKLKE